MAPKRPKKDQFVPKDLVLAKMPGFPAWPSFIMPKEMIPDAISKANKKKTANICVIFIPDGDYYWMNEKNLEFLDEEKLDAKISKISKANVLKFKEKLKSKTNHRNSSINDAFLSTKGLEFDVFMDQLNDRLNKVSSKVEADDVEEEEEEAAEEEEEGSEVQEEEAEDAEGDNLAVKNGHGLEEEEEEDDDDEGQGEEQEESVKTEGRSYTRNGKKLNNGTSSTHLDESNLSIKEDVTFEDESEIILNGKSGIAKQSDDEVTRKRTTSSGESNGGLSQRSKRFKTESPGPVSKPNNHKKELTEEERLQQLWLCRIKLQKSLIQRDNEEKPNADELSTSRLILKRLVDFKINLQLLKTTKIHKVLKCIIKDKSLEFPESFKLHDQCQELLTKWAGLIEEIKLEKTADYLNKQRKVKSNDDTTNDEINDQSVDESVKSSTELKYASVES